METSQKLGKGKYKQEYKENQESKNKTP